MSIIDLITQFFNLPTLAGIIILTRFIESRWVVIAIAVTLIIVGLMTGGAR